jgi:hypothetical protein
MSVCFKVILKRKYILIIFFYKLILSSRNMFTNWLFLTVPHRWGRNKSAIYMIHIH